MSTSTQVMELFNIFSKTYSKEEAQIIVKDIEELVDTKNKELTTKGDLREVELKLTKEIELTRREIESVRLEVEKAKSSLVKWFAGLLIAYTGVIVTILTLWK
ncbi:MAG: hypothetical protein AB1611_20600 [bacterium]